MNKARITKILKDICLLIETLKCRLKIKNRGVTRDEMDEIKRNVNAHADDGDRKAVVDENEVVCLCF